MGTSTCKDRIESPVLITRYATQILKKNTLRSLRSPINEWSSNGRASGWWWRWFNGGGCGMKFDGARWTNPRQEQSRAQQKRQRPRQWIIKECGQDSEREREGDNVHRNSTHWLFINRADMEFQWIRMYGHLYSPPTGLWEDKCNEGLLNFPPESYYYYWIHSDRG